MRRFRRQVTDWGTRELGKIWAAGTRELGELGDEGAGEDLGCWDGGADAVRGNVASMFLEGENDEPVAGYTGRQEAPGRKQL